MAPNAQSGLFRHTLGLMLILLCIGPLLFTPGPQLSAQHTRGEWTLSFHLAGLGPMAENDRWYVTDEGYHVHPFSDGFTPGFNVGIAFQASSYLQAGFSVLLGRAPVTLGMIDQFSTEEPETKESMGFLGFLLSPSLTLPGGRDWSIMLGPSMGLGWMQEVNVEPPFGPTVTFGGGTEFIMGGMAGLDVRLGDSPFSFSGRVMGLSLTLPLFEDGQGQRMSKDFGPLGLLAGFTYIGL